MRVGENFLAPLCNLDIFASRRESCYRNGAVEMRDRVAVLILASLTFVFVILIRSDSFQRKASKKSFVIFLFDAFAIIAITTTIAARDYYPSLQDVSIDEYSGLGLTVAIVVFVLALFSVVIVNFKLREHLFSALNGQKSFLRSAISIVAFAIFATLFLPSVLITKFNVSRMDVSTHVFNELLSAVSGNFELAGSIPQYTSLLGIPPFVFSKLFGFEATISLLPTWLSILNLGILGGLSIIWCRLFSSTPFTVALLGVSSLLLARSSNTNSFYTIASFSSWTVRMILPTVTALILLSLFSKQSINTRFVWSSLLGISVVVTTTNNLEFGLTCAIAVSCSLIILLSYKQLEIKSILGVMLGMAFASLSIFIFYHANNKALDFKLYYLISKEFGSNGFGSWPMPKVGFFYVIFALGGLPILMASNFLNRHKELKMLDQETELIPAVALAVFGGVWTMTSLTFYSARSVHGNLRVIFIPALISALALFKLIQPSLQSALISRKFKLSIFPTLLLMVMPIAFIVAAPFPAVSWSRIFSDDEPTWSLASLRQSPIVKAYEELNTFGYEDVGIMTSNGNAISIVTGGVNVLMSNDLVDLSISETIRQETCQRLKLSGVKFVLVEGIFEAGENYPCIGMSRPQLVGNGLQTIFNYSQSSD